MSTDTPEKDGYSNPSSVKWEILQNQYGLD